MVPRRVNKDRTTHTENGQTKQKKKKRDKLVSKAVIQLFPHASHACNSTALAIGLNSPVTEEDKISCLPQEIKSLQEKIAKSRRSAFWSPAWPSDEKNWKAYP